MQEISEKTLYKNVTSIIGVEIERLNLNTIVGSAVTVKADRRRLDVSKN